MEAHTPKKEYELAESYKLELEDVTLEAVNEDLSSSNKYVKLINGVSVTFESGKLSAIMGPSGSGKTTLINSIVGMVQEGSMTYGRILFREEERDPKTWLFHVAYLSQDDCTAPYITVYEYIYFCVNCRTTRKQRGGRSTEEVVDEVMKRLHIESLRDVVMTAVSGGERKRVMIAIEFAVVPDVLILDEPTTGLDSHLAFELIQMVKQYAVENNKIVITTIHQPGPGLFDMFDSLLFLHEGSVVYSGPADRCESFFNTKGIHRTGLSMSEFLFELFSNKSSVPGIEEYREMVNQMKESAFQEGMSKSANKTLKCNNDSVTKLPFSFWKAFQIAKRQWTLEWRSWMMMKSRLFEILFLAFYICVSYPIFFITQLANLANMFHLNTDEKTDSESTYLWLLNSLKSKVDESLSPNIDETIKWQQSLPLFLSILFFNSSGLLDGVDYIFREMSKATYGASTLYFSVWIVEIPPMILKCFAFIALTSLTGVKEGNTPQLIAYITIGSFLVSVFNMMTRVFGSTSGVLRVLQSTVNTVFIFLVTPGSLYMISARLDSSQNGIVGYLKFLKYPLMLLWPKIFFESFMNLSFFERVLFSQELNEKASPIYKAAIGFLLGLPLDTNLSTEETKAMLCDPQMKFLADYDYSKYLLLPLLVLSFMVVVQVSNYFLVRRYAPHLRLKLSTQ
ncbi:ABC TRANSPORTER [Encephalitozoon cuniculi GB-M1]|uniref:ABC TRANSPORTER n=2 Tax=Encephalitozoon cuniculi TaxID=6035 RepID=Q8SR08_ENCCU|nr:uncharacterized protein ECU10_1520 [Encephalitozoon cuniculi GB-M1]AGE96136.1 ABC transporter [Encephalitozoon cuniculi]UYI26617.1 sterolin subunit [Encephalitozoon cuniculi]CAD25872.1 ABC TRANSPORTER [Encephalitozoon cuniculi GB-M1]